LSLLVAVFFELQYVTVTRIVLPHFALGVVGLELAITVVRLLTIPLYWYFYRDVIGRFTSDGKETRLAAFWLGCAVFLLLPIVVPPDSYHPRGIANALFALTSFVVGFREELVYRGVIQNLFARKIGLGPALIASNIMFVMYHAGAVHMTPVAIAELFAGGLIFGLIYAGSRSLVVAALVHGMYDAIASFAPYVERNPYPGVTIVVLELVAIVVLVRWMTTVRDAALS
jgi:membrane protease YdiL (CAAX protease family)